MWRPLGRPGDTLRKRTNARSPGFIGGTCRRPNARVARRVGVSPARWLMLWLADVTQKISHFCIYLQ